MFFVAAAYKFGWVLWGGFDWAEWMKTQEAQRLRDDREALSRATPDQLARLLTVLIRQAEAPYRKALRELKKMRPPDGSGA